MMKVELTYFKPSGKFYTSGDYMTAKAISGPNGGPIMRAYKAKVTALEASATLVIAYSTCAGQGSEHLFAVTLEKAVPKVSAVLAATYFCGE